MSVFSVNLDHDFLFVNYFNLSALESFVADHGFFKSVSVTVSFVDKLLHHELHRDGPCREFFILTGRSWLVNIRQPLVTFATLGQNIVTAILIGVLYFHQSKSQDSVRVRNVVVHL